MSTLKYFTHNTLKNCHIELTPTGCVVWVSLNVTAEVSKHLAKSNVFKAEKRIVYALRKTVDSPSIRSISDAYDELLNKCMINCRLAKSNVLNAEIQELITNSTK